MVPLKLLLAGLLEFLAPRSLALRGLQRGLPEGFVPGESTNVAFRRDNLTRFKTLQNLTDAIVKLIQEAREPELLERGIMDTWRTCRMNQSACGLSDLVPGGSTSIYPGGRTRCLLGDEFSFQVYPGAADKLYIHLGGGGACWDEVTSIAAPVCKTEVEKREFMGLFNKCPGSSPFDGYTVVFVPACSGDLFGGNVTRPWKHPDNRTIAAHGYANARSAVDWARANMNPQLSRLVVAGNSAGSIGTQLWASTLLREFRPQQARILADSYIGVLPKGFEQKLFRELGTCDLFFNSTSPLFEMCHKGNLTIMDVYSAAMREFPEVLFASTSSKHDSVQVLFHVLAMATQSVDMAAEYCGHVDPAACDLSNAPPDLSQMRLPIGPTEYHKRVEEIIAGYSENPNYVSYLMSGKAHDVFFNVFGDCDLNTLLHDPTAFWLNGHKGSQRMGAQKWAFDFLGVSSANYSVCEHLAESDEDDYCIDKQMLK